MPKYYVHLTIELSRLVVVEAEDEEEAEALAKEGKGETEEEMEGAYSVEHVEPYED